MIKIRDLKLNEIKDMFVSISNIAEKVASNNKEYIECVMSDGEDSITAKIWSTKEEDLKSKGIFAGEVIKIRAKLSEWEKKSYLQVSNYRIALDEDGVNQDDFIKKAPVSAEKMYEYIEKCVKKFKNKHLKNLTLEILNQHKVKLMYFAGAQKVHHNVKSGLLYHMYRMLLSGEKLAEIYEVLDKELFFAGIILHDIGKVVELNSDKKGNVDDYTKDGKLLGHIIQGIKIVTITSFKLEIPDNVSALIEHIIASHHYSEDMGAFKKPMFLEAELIHHLDVIDSRAYIIEETEKSLESDTFSEKEYFLENRQIYKHNIQ